MKTAEIREKSVDALNDELLELRREQFKLRMQLGMGETPRPHQFKRVRHGIARVKTILNEKERNNDK
ncbi:MAG: 50S ribosomal protein L29 [Coxiella sp. (in: Bacteria)]|nr:MAG: 50S ribosomal protein L29 [Coxiella sp. (in: g-proteobacteria)]